VIFPISQILTAICLSVYKFIITVKLVIVVNIGNFGQNEVKTGNAVKIFNCNKKLKKITDEKIPILLILPLVTEVFTNFY
jgi:uncharacterized membrane protein